MMKNGMTLLRGMGTGALLMYLLDPAQGRRRRALLSDGIIRYCRDAGCAIGAATRDLANRARGIAARTRALLEEEDAPRSVLEARVRSQLGRVVSHPGAIEVHAAGGRVTLSGPVLAGEVENLLCTAMKVPGVRDVENRLEIHEHPDNVPALQGGAPRTGRRRGPLEGSWVPAARVIALLAGASLALRAAASPRVLGTGVPSAGLALLARGLAARPIRRGRGAPAAAPRPAGQGLATEVTGRLRERSRE